MEARALGYRALTVLRAILHQKANVDLAEIPDPAIVVERISLLELACERTCGPVTRSQLELDAKSRL